MIMKKTEVLNKLKYKFIFMFKIKNNYTNSLKLSKYLKPITFSQMKQLQTNIDLQKDKNTHKFIFKKE